MRGNVLLGLLAAFLFAALALAFFIDPHRSPEEPRDWNELGAGGGFKESARQAGIAFRMKCLPGEQGEDFKINLYDHGCGVAVGDYDGDGYEDIYFVNQLGTNALYRNRGDGSFEDATRYAGVGLGDRICVGATFADYDNDGHADLYVTSTRGGNVLFKNLGNGKFRDVTKEAGVDLVAHCQTAVFFDYDGDGFLDLFVTCTAKWTTSFDRAAGYYRGAADLVNLAGSPREFNVLYRNNGNGTFSDVTVKAGLKGVGWGGDTSVFDFDEDGYIDLLVTNMFGRSQLYRNNGDGSFADVTDKALGRTSWGAIGSKAFDFDNDGKLDLLIVDMHSDMWLPADVLASQQVAEFMKKNEKVRYPGVTGPSVLQKNLKAQDAERMIAAQFQIKYDRVIFGNTLFKNLGGGRFKEVADEAGLETFWPWGIATGDFDNDGFEDVFLPSGMGYPYFYWPNRLLMNQGDGTFAESAAKEGIEPPAGGQHLPEKIGNVPATRSSRCAAVADFRNNGGLDIVTNNFNDAPYYFKNQFPQRNYLSLRLRGSKSNRDAIGAVARLRLGDKTVVRQVHAAGGYLSHSSRTLHFGLGDQRHVDRLEIQWPSGLRQVIDAPEINRLHRIVEPAATR
ncbi:MAG: CRTAC1 family protein [Planctomycetes bacterium]|nr:CRTAC1 family protein [Planctomycetota bacterium]